MRPCRPPRFGLEPVDQVDDIVEAAAGAGADAIAGDGDRQVALAGAGSADQYGVALVGEEGAGGQIADHPFVDGSTGELELGELLGQRQLGDSELVFDRTGLLLGDLGFEELADDPLHRVLALQPVGHQLIEGGPHAGELEGTHHLDNLMTLHWPPSSGCRIGRSPRPAHAAGAAHRG